MKIRYIVLVAIALGALAACTLPHTDLKSPCVGIEGSPCARRPVNNWWLQNHNQNQPQVQGEVG
jgi:hypothetical protein